MDQKLTDNLKVVVIECPYNTLTENALTKKLFSEYVSFKLTGFLAEHPHGVLPLSSYDFIANLIMLCEKKSDELTPVMGFKSVTVERCEYFGLPFEISQYFIDQGFQKHNLVTQNIVSNGKNRGIQLGFNSSWTIHPAWRESHECKMYAKEISVALFTSYYLTYGIAEILINGTLRFKVDKLLASMGFKNLKIGDEDLPAINCPFLFGEKTQLMHLVEFSKEALTIASKFSELWSTRITIADNSKLQPHKHKIAA